MTDTIAEPRTLLGDTIVLSHGREAGPRGAEGLSEIQIDLYRRFGSELLRITGGVAPIDISYPATPAFEAAATAIAGSSDIRLKIQLHALKPPGADTDIIAERDAVNGAITRGGDGFQVLLVSPEVVRVLLCGNSDLSREEADELVCAGVALMGFGKHISTQISEGRRGTQRTTRKRAEPRLVAFSKSPEVFSLDSPDHE